MAAGIPLFTRDVGTKVQPRDLSVESLSPWRSFQEGVALADRLPSTPLAIARGIQGATELSNRNTQAAQQIERNNLVNEQLSMNLEKQQAIDPMIIEAKQKELEVARDKYVEEIKINQKRDSLIAVMEGNNGAAKKDAYLSGQYADVFAADPKLGDSVLRTAAQYMSDEEIARLHGRQNRIKQDSYYERNQFENAQKAQKAQGAFSGHPQVQEYFQKHKDEGVTYPDIAESFSYEPMGKLEIADGRVVIENGNPKVDPKYDRDEIPRQYLLYNKKTGEVIDTHVPKEDKLNYYKLLTDMSGAQGTFATNTSTQQALAEETARRAAEYVNNPRGLTDPAMQGRAAQPQGTQDTDVQQGANVQAAPPVQKTQPNSTTIQRREIAKKDKTIFEPPPISKTKKSIASKKLVTEQGNVSVPVDELLPDLSEGLGVNFEKSNGLKSTATILLNDFAAVLEGKDVTNAKVKDLPIAKAQFVQRALMFEYRAKGKADAEAEARRKSDQQDMIGAKGYRLRESMKITIPIDADVVAHNKAVAEYNAKKDAMRVSVGTPDLSLYRSSSSSATSPTTNFSYSAYESAAMQLLKGIGIATPSATARQLIPPVPNVKVDSAEELYVQRNYSRMSSRLDMVLENMREAIERQQREVAKRNVTPESLTKVGQGALL